MTARLRRFALAFFVVLVATAAPQAVVAQGTANCARFGAPSGAGRVQSTELTEISGLAASRTMPGALWAHNDSGGKPEVFLLGDDGRDLGTLRLDAQARDWEDMAIAGDSMYLGDIGDNNASRDEVVVYRVAEPTRAPEPSRVVTAVEAFRLRYPAGAEDAEALLVDPISGDLVIVTKNANGRPRVLSVARSALQSGKAATMRDHGLIQLPEQAAVTGGDISADGSLVLLRTYGAAFAFDRAAGASVSAALATAPCRVETAFEAQGESIAIATDGTRFTTVSEGPNRPLHVVPIALSTTPTSLGAAPTTTTTPTTIESANDGGTPWAIVALIAVAVVGAVLVVLRLRNRQRA